MNFKLLVIRINMIPLKLVMILLFFCSGHSFLAQELSEEIKMIVKDSDQSKITKAQSYLNQGNQILFPNAIDANADSIPDNNLNYIELSENLLVGKRVSRLLYDTKDYYKTGFEGKIKVYQQYIDEYLGTEKGLFYTEVEGLRDSIYNSIQFSKEIRNKSKVTANLKKGGNYIHESNLQYQKTVLYCKQAMGYISRDKMTPVTENMVDSINWVKKNSEESLLQKEQVLQEHKITNLVSSSSSPLIVDNKKTEVSKTIESDKAKEIAVVERKNEIQAKVEVYYTVQILADKKTVPQNRIKQVYSGDHPIIANKGDGWFRYSFGKFNTINDAKKALEQSKTKGYVVAYKNNVRISLSEAKAWFALQ